VSQCEFRKRVSGGIYYCVRNAGHIGAHYDHLSHESGEWYRLALAPSDNDPEARWWRRMEYLFRELPFEIRHRWGGDAQEMVEGIDHAIKSPRATPGNAVEVGVRLPSQRETQ